MESAKTREAARLWLLLGVAALALAGLFSLVLVVARTPALSSIPLFQKIFHEALVVHVDLSVLVWFLCVACMFWSRQVGRGSVLEKGALISMALGSLLLCLSPLDPAGEALMSNYIPVIASPVFFLGLALIACATALQLAHYFAGARMDWTVQSAACYSAGLVALLSLLCFVLSGTRLPPDLAGVEYYEKLYWAGGHVLQYLHGQFLMLCWLLLAGWSGQEKLTPSLSLAFAVGVLAAAAGPLAYMYPVESEPFRRFFTLGMMVAGGIGPFIVALSVLPRLQNIGKNACTSSLVMSLLLFGYGGVLGLMIHGQNVTIPAHYHGSIVGVTLAFGGIAYFFLPRFGYRDVSRTRLAFWQPIVYGTGQIMHISGLAWSGGYGVLRKTPGALEGSAKAAMGLMGGGGFIAIIGGLMLVIAVWRSVRPAR